MHTATAAGGIPYIVQDRINGRLTPRGSSQALAQAALDLLRAPEQFVDIVNARLGDVVTRSRKEKLDHRSATLAAAGGAAVHPVVPSRGSLGASAWALASTDHAGRGAGRANAADVVSSTTQSTSSNRPVPAR